MMPSSSGSYGQRNFRCGVSPLSDMSALCQKRTHAPQQKSRYSITSSASATSVGGAVRLSASAVLRLTANSNSGLPQQIPEK
jgi:hypothetical protein